MSDIKGTIEFKALWDTGANMGAISQKAVDLLGLYLENIEMAGSLRGAADILIGMDVIQLGDFAISNSQNKTTVSFCYPPLQNGMNLAKLSDMANEKIKHS